LTEIIDDIHLGVERSVSKSFDSMSHDLLLHKLRFKFGFSSTACRLFVSFLSPRTQKAMNNGKCLDSVDISIGSLQGSVLSPFLFACFINDVDDHVRNSRFHLYADDLQIYTVDGCGDVNWLVALVNGCSCQTCKGFWIGRVRIPLFLMLLRVLKWVQIHIIQLNGCVMNFFGRVVYSRK
jgi:hypothetical protein